jgi:hypothetical protein
MVQGEDTFPPVVQMTEVHSTLQILQYTSYTLPYIFFRFIRWMGGPIHRIVLPDGLRRCRHSHRRRRRPLRR